MNAVQAYIDQNTLSALKRASLMETVKDEVVPYEQRAMAQSMLRRHDFTVNVFVRLSPQEQAEIAEYEAERRRRYDERPDFIDLLDS